MFTVKTAHEKVKAAQKLWNTKDPGSVIKAYTPDCTWRNRSDFLHGHAQIKAFLERKWQKEQHYKLRKELFGVLDNRISVQFWYEYLNDGQWYRCYGLEHWIFNEDGRMRSRMMSGNEIPINEEDRWFKDGADVDEVSIPDGHVSELLLP